MWKCFLFWFTVGVGWGAEIPAGTRVEVRLLTHVSTVDSRVGDRVEAVVIRPVFVGGVAVLPDHCRVLGRVSDLRKPVEPRPQTLLFLEFQSITDPGGRFGTSLAARVQSVDDARETVDPEGDIVGIDESKTPAARIDQGLAKLSDKFPSLGDFLGTAKSAIVKKSDPNITYEPGVELTLELTRPLMWSGSEGLPDVGEVRPEDWLYNLVNAEPYQTMATKPTLPSDITNLMFIGDREQIEQAFTEAGWSMAAKLSQSSKFETILALVEERGYKEAPMSTLLLEGEPPEFGFQKLNNTFAKRHHLRIWLRPEQFQGKQVWVCAATHDVSIEFSKESRTFIHKIDPHIDLERAKVVSDLLFTGRVRGVSLVSRPNVPRSGKNATGDSLQTDGRMAVLEF